MGVTLFNLYLPKAAYDALPIGPGCTVRQNPSGWVALLPQTPEGEDVEQTIRSLTVLAKAGPGPALLLEYLDDDEYTLSLYADGKKRAALNSWGKIRGKAWFVRALPEDPEAGKKLGLLSRCRTMDEQLALLEETFGLALYDLYDEPPRIMERSAETYRRIKAREEELKKRKNRFRPVSVEEKDWPQGLKAWFAQRGRTRYPRTTPTYLPPPEWLTKYGIVARIGEYPSGCNHLPDGDSVFRTEASGERQAILWRISGKDGSVVYQRTLPEKSDERTWNMSYLPSAHVYLYAPTAYLSEEEQKERQRLWQEEHALAASKRKVLVVLDDQFQEIRRFALDHYDTLFPPLTVFGGPYAWLLHFSCGAYTRLNLQTGEATALRLEVPAYLKYGLADGTLYAVDPREKGLLCFDETGRLLSRHRVKGQAWPWVENETMYFWDDQEYMEGPGDALPRLWRLD